MVQVEVYGIGEILVDIIKTSLGPISDGSSFEAHFGGAPANTIIGISRLNHKAGMIASIGNDQFGDFLLNTLKDNNVDTKFIIRKRARTTLAFVILSESGERRFFFYRLPWTKTADTMLSLEDIELDYILKAKVIHVSGFSLSYDPLSSTVLKVMREASKRDIEVSYDPNFRYDIWPSISMAINAYNECLKYTTFLSMGSDEIMTFHKGLSYREIADELLNKYDNLKVVAIRLGSNGAYVKTRKKEVSVPAFNVKVIDTTGAGDAWTAGFIVYYFLEKHSLRKATELSNAVAAIKCTRHGAITSLPYKKEVIKFIKSTNLNYS